MSDPAAAVGSDAAREQTANLRPDVVGNEQEYLHHPSNLPKNQSEDYDALQQFNSH